MNPTRTYEAMANFIEGEFDKLQVTINEAFNAVRDTAGTADAFDATLGLANKLTAYGAKIATHLHNQTLIGSREHESRQLELPFPPN